MKLIPFAIGWGVLATVVAILAVWRQVIARKEDDYVHVNVDIAPQQQAIAKKLEVIDRWGKSLTIIATLYGLLILGLFLYNGWIEAARAVSE